MLKNSGYFFLIAPWVAHILVLSQIQGYEVADGCFPLVQEHLRFCRKNSCFKGIFANGPQREVWLTWNSVNFNYLKLLSFVTRSACHESFIQGSTLSGLMNGLILSDPKLDIVTRLLRSDRPNTEQTVQRSRVLHSNTQKMKSANREIIGGAIEKQNL